MCRPQRLTYQPYEIMVNNRQPIHIGTKHDRNGHHFEANLQEIVICRESVAAVESLDEEQALRVFQM